MTNVRDAVARAICKSEMGIAMLDDMPNSEPRYYSSADAAITACGDVEMRRALATIVERNDSACDPPQWIEAIDAARSVLDGFTGE